jgi:hypothetical protein
MAGWAELLPRPKRWIGGQAYNYPPSHLNTGSGMNVPTPKGLQAPFINTRPDVAMDQRESELFAAFGSHHPYQDYLRQVNVVQVIPQMGISHKLYAPGGPQQQQNGAKDDGGTRSRNVGGSTYGAGGPYSQSAIGMGMYKTDYTQMISTGAAKPLIVHAPPQYQSGPGYLDITSQIIINGQYSMINSDMASMYANLRAPSPFEGLQQCQ